MTHGLLARTLHRPIIDSKGWILAILVSSPCQSSYYAFHMRFFDKMIAEGDAANFGPGELNHKREKGFAAINAGLLYGNGHKKLTWLMHGGWEIMVDNLLGDQDLQQLAAYQNS